MSGSSSIAVSRHVTNRLQGETKENPVEVWTVERTIEGSGFTLSGKGSCKRFPKDILINC